MKLPSTYPELRELRRQLVMELTVVTDGTHAAADRLAAHREHVQTTPRAATADYKIVRGGGTIKKTVHSPEYQRLRAEYLLVCERCDELWAQLRECHTAMKTHGGEHEAQWLKPEEMA
jgi:hypothetical protein